MYLRLSLAEQVAVDIWVHQRSALLPQWRPRLVGRSPFHYLTQGRQVFFQNAEDAVQRAPWRCPYADRGRCRLSGVILLALASGREFVMEGEAETLEEAHRVVVNAARHAWLSCRDAEGPALVRGSEVIAIRLVGDA